ncbi:hypothetical protein BS78_05G174100 [Paspalum vaginatum]|nr:hypothetical protein BS78_05G174100 [Paspalum vaginatum]
MAHPSPPPSWLILSAEARVSSVPDDAPFILPHDADAPLPPRISVLTLSPRLFHGDGGQTYHDHDDPSIIAVDPSSGLLLLRRFNSNASPPPPLFRAGAACFALDVRAITASQVPEQSHPSHDGNEYHDFHSSDHLGLIAAPRDLGGGHYTVADLWFESGGHEGTLTCFFSGTGKYLEKDVEIPRPDCNWSFNIVVSHRGKLWWVDKANGLLYCDPFLAHPDMTMDYVLLPNPKDDDDRSCSCHGCSRRDKDEIASRRRVQLINAKFRCAHITCPNAAAAPTVTMRTLSHPESTNPRWGLDYKLCLADIWDSNSYKARELPRHHPVLALIHPTNPDILYFGLDGRLFSVDARRKELLDCQPHQLSSLRSDSLIAWVPPPQSAGFHKKGSTGNGSREESATAPA